MRSLLVAWTLLAACDPAKSPGAGDTGLVGAGLDADGDGFTEAEGDCDDGSAAAFPGAPERCNGADDDCDGEIDEDPIDATTWYPDLDGDGFVGEAGAVVACEPPDAGIWGDYVQDCHDGDAAVFPGAAEICNGLDDDCDADTSEAGMVAVDGVPFSSVQAAVDAADREDTVWVCAGEWEGPLVVPHTLVLRGAGSDAVSISAGEGSPVLTVAEGTVELVGMTLVGGSAEVGAGIDARDASALSLEDVVVRDSLGADACGGIAGPREGGLALVDSRVTGHDLRVRGDGGCVCAFELSLVDSELSACSAGRGGGAFVLEEAVLEGTSEVHENLALLSGGGLYLDDATLVGGDVHDNAARDGGGVAGAGTLQGVVLRENGAQGDGGGLWLGDDTVLEGVTVQDNEARGGGGGLWLSEEGWVAVEDGSFSGNDPDDIAGEAFSQGAPDGDFFCTPTGCE